MAKSERYQQLGISLPAHAYPIYIGYQCLADEELLQRHILSRQVLVVSNNVVAPLYLESVLKALRLYQCDVVLLSDGEKHKNQRSLFKIYNALITNQHNRDTTVIALGGGVIGDLAGFAASTYQRGVRLIQIPTTLLAQVDSSVGGKTAINHPLGKNLIGSFYQPDAVIMDASVLTTLPKRELCAGFGEIVKYAFLAGGDFMTKLRDWLNEQNNNASVNDAKLIEIIAECCRIKACYVQNDEREHNQRALLNLGHTFAHALESYTSYKRWRHGEAVGIGLFCAALLSYQRGYLQKDHLLLMDALLAQAKLPRRIPKALDLQKLHALMLHDKKARNQRLRFVLIKAPGDCFLDDSITTDDVLKALNGALEGDFE